MHDRFIQCEYISEVKSKYDVMIFANTVSY